MIENKVRYLTFAEYARLYHVSRQRVHQWVMSGRLGTVKITEKIKVIPANTPRPDKKYRGKGCKSLNLNSKKIN